MEEKCVGVFKKEPNWLKNFCVTPDLFSLKFGFSKKQLQQRRPVPLTNVEMGD